MMFFFCSGVRVLMSTSMYTCCFFMESISFFIPSMVFCLSNPSVLLTIGSKRIFSVCSSVMSSQVYAVISTPFFVWIVTFVILSLLVGGSCAVSGLAGPVAASAVRCCFGRLPSAASSETVRFGDGSDGLVWQLVGAVAIGESAMAHRVDVPAGAAGCCAWSCGCCVVSAPKACVPVSAVAGLLIGL